MHIATLQGADASPAAGHAVVIDVLRAFTCAAYALAAGAREIWLCSAVEEAFALRDRASRPVLIGESGGRDIPGFDYGNSPAALRAADLSGRTAILRSTNGTQGVVRAAAGPEVEQIWLGSLVVAGATARALRQRGADRVTLVAMGWLAGEPPAGERGPRDPNEGDEDDACADYLRARLTGAEVDRAAIARRVEDSPAGRRALDPAYPWISPEDVACAGSAASIDRFDFAMPVTRADGLLVARPLRAGGPRSPSTTLTGSAS